MNKWILVLSWGITVLLLSLALKIALFAFATEFTIEPTVVTYTVAEVKPHPIVAALIQCESGGRNVKIVDANGYYSYGILQYQSSTWNWWSRESGIEGDPMNEKDAIKMANWAVANGYGFHWTCFHLLGLSTPSQLTLTNIE